MSQTNPNDRRPWTAPQPIGYQTPQPKSQWATDDSAYATCLVYAAIVLTIIGSVVGAILWFFWEVITSFLG